MLSENTHERQFACVCVSICVREKRCLFTRGPLDFCESSIQCHMGPMQIIFALSFSTPHHEGASQRAGWRGASADTL